MYELYDPCTIMFFFRNKHIMIDLGTGNNNKVRPQGPVLPTLSLAALATISQTHSSTDRRALPPPITQINFLIPDKQEVIDIIETVYRGARKGRGLVVSPKDYSTKYRY